MRSKSLYKWLRISRKGPNSGLDTLVYYGHDLSKAFLAKITSLLYFTHTRSES